MQTFAGIERHHKEYMCNYATGTVSLAFAICRMSKYKSVLRLFDFNR